eukprot:3941555-Rhodomonas_salina.1
MVLSAYAMSGTDQAYDATRCPVLSSRVVLPGRSVCTRERVGGLAAPGLRGERLSRGPECAVWEYLRPAQREAASRRGWPRATGKPTGKLLPAYARAMRCACTVVQAYAVCGTEAAYGGTIVAYAVCGTDAAYGGTNLWGVWYCGSVRWYQPMRCVVLMQRTVVPAYAVCSTDAAYSGTSLCGVCVQCYQPMWCGVLMQRTVVPAYVVRSTDAAYGGTSLCGADVRWYQVSGELLKDAPAHKSTVVSGTHTAAHAMRTRFLCDAHTAAYVVRTRLAVGCAHCFVWGTHTFVWGTHTVSYGVRTLFRMWYAHEFLCDSNTAVSYGTTTRAAVCVCDTNTGCVCATNTGALHDRNTDRVTRTRTWYEHGCCT